MFEHMNDIFWLAAIGLICVMLGASFLLASEHQRRMQTGRLRRATGAERAVTSGGAAGYGKRPSLHWTSFLRPMVVRMGERLAVVLGGEARETAADLASAGYRGRDALLIYAFLKTVLPAAGMMGGLIWLTLTKPLGLGMMIPFAIVVAGALALSKAVDIFVGIKRKKRLDAIRLSFPDLLELLVITSEAGLGPQPGLRRVAEEMSLTDPDLAREVLQLVSEMSMTNDRRAAYAKFNARTPLPEIGVFTQTLDQSDRYGTPFSRAMRNLIAEQRSNRLMSVEEKAARLPVIMTLPLIFCIMPAVFVVLVGPAALSVFDNIINGGM